LGNKLLRHPTGPIRYKGRTLNAMNEGSDVTGLLVAWSNGEEEARSALIAAVYGELRNLARAYLRRERPDHSMPPTALVHEAYVKLVDQTRVRWQNRAHFFGVAAQQMRRILVDHARARGAGKRGAAVTVPLSDLDVGIDPPHAEIVALDIALDKLARIDTRQSQLVELRYFAGLTVEETAAILGVSPITVKRDWALARAWLFRELQGPAA
jgi:RNA polymerase sigma factor (TIGR02999 family)